MNYVPQCDSFSHDTNHPVARAGTRGRHEVGVTDHRGRRVGGLGGPAAFSIAGIARSSVIVSKEVRPGTVRAVVALRFGCIQPATKR